MAFQLVTGRRECFLWILLLVYAIGRISQIYADRLPTLLIVTLHVVPPALLALAHGVVLYRPKGIAVFTASCLGFGALAESLSLRTGFPFGHYYFTTIMGPQIFQLPLLLALAYLGIGYVAWILAILITGGPDEPIRGPRLVTVPLLASFIMLAWDLSMDPDWSTLDRAWIWRDGGAYFGVPASNFFGWFLTAYCYYQTFSLYCGARPVLGPPKQRRFWYPPILTYVFCALGNLLILKLPMAPPVVADATGRIWHTSQILTNCVLISIFVMLPLAVLGWLRTPHGIGRVQRSGLRTASD